MTIPDESPPPFEEDVSVLWKWAIRAIALIATVLGGLFAWVQLRAIPFPPIENAEPTHVRRIVLAVYYTCWVAGTTVDANIQKEVYVRDPEHGNVPGVATFAVAGLLGVGALLLWASDSDERISLALGPFLVVNVIAWRILVHRISPIISASALSYREERQYYRLEQLDIVKGYLTGRWQWARFLLMGLIVIGANILCFDGATRDIVARRAQAFLPTATTEAIHRLLPVAALCLFVVLAEAWVWILRARNAIALRTIADVARRYTFRPRST